jgi:hypothetical protein
MRHPPFHERKCPNPAELFMAPRWITIRRKPVYDVAAPGATV